MAKILVVEDDSFFREVFSDLLKEEGYLVDAASSGEEAMSLLAEGDYQVVITDLMLHDISGLDILSRVKDQDPSIDVIMVTGHANLETAVFALKHGARDYLTKPINHDELKHSVAQCFEQRRLLDENLELKTQINLFQVSQAIANCQEEERVYKLIFDSLAKEVGVSRGVGYFCEDGEPLVLKEVKGFDEETGKALGAAVMGSFDAQTGKEGSFFLLNRILPAAAEARLEGAADLRETLTLFIRSKTNLLGVVFLYNEPGRNLPGDINLRNVHFLLEQASLALENTARYAKARNLLNVDELTGLFNYRYLDITLDREIKRSERYGSNLSVIFVDIDFFKNVNDTHGHLVGSRVLRDVGTLLKKSVREEDTVIRYGGDEYTIILVETGMIGAAAVAERIRRSIEEHVFLADQGMNIRITASLGCACYPDDSQVKTGLLEMADRAMYRGKELGKNMVYYMSQGK
ncbi:MAG TPA: diguanylate cyclase [Geobacteraceae bacterium]